MMEKRYIDLIHELEDCNTARNKAAAERDAARVEVDALRDTLQDWQVAAGTREAERDELRDKLLKAREDLGASRVELATTHNTLEDAVAERNALRELVVEWQPFTEAAQGCQGSLLVWREDAGTFVAFYDDDARCWFTESGEDLTGDLPTFYAKMPKGPTSK